MVVYNNQGPQSRPQNSMDLTTRTHKQDPQFMETANYPNLTTIAKPRSGYRIGSSTFLRTSLGSIPNIPTQKPQLTQKEATSEGPFGSFQEFRGPSIDPKQKGSCYEGTHKRTPNSQKQPIRQVRPALDPDVRIEAPRSDSAVCKSRRKPKSQTFDYFYEPCI